MTVSLLQIVVVYGRRPRLKDFNNRITVTNDVYYHLFLIKQEQEGWYYLSVLPGENVVTSNSVYGYLLYGLAVVIAYTLFSTVENVQTKMPSNLITQ